MRGLWHDWQPVFFSIFYLSHYSSWGPLAHTLLKTGVVDPFNTHVRTRHAAHAWFGPIAGMLQSYATAEKSRRGWWCETNVFSFWPCHGVQPNGNSTGTFPALSMTQLPIQGAREWFLGGLKMVGMDSQCCPVSMQDEPSSQMVLWWSPIRG